MAEAGDHKAALSGFLSNLKEAFARFGGAMQQLVSAADRTLLPVRSMLWRRDYEVTSNGLRAWQVYHLHRKAGEAPPDWVLEYFDNVADEFNILWQAAQGGKKIDNATDQIARVLKMKTGRGPGNVFSRQPPNSAPSNWHAYALAVYAHMQEGDMETYAIERTAKAFGVSRSTVLRSWDWAKTLLPNIVSE